MPALLPYPVFADALIMPPASHDAGLLASAMLVVAACAPRDPPTPDASPTVAVPESLVSASASAPAAAAEPSVTDAAPPPDRLDAAADPALLPQTRDKPAASGAPFDARVVSLWDAIVADDPGRGLVAFFPLGAYKQVKDVADPASDWKRRLVAAYVHDIHALHAHLGRSARDAKLVGLEVPESRARWVNPGEEYNKIGYWRVFGSKLRYEVGAGQSRSFEVKSLISWRGEWYVVHLSAIQ